MDVYVTHGYLSLDPSTWPYHDMETVSTLPALCEGNPPVTVGFPSQKASYVGFVFFC